MNDFQEQAKNWLRNVVKQNPDKIKAGVEKAGDLIDKQTGGKYAEKVDAVQEKVGTYVDSHAAETSTGPAGPPDQSPGSTTSASEEAEPTDSTEPTTESPTADETDSAGTEAGSAVDEGAAGSSDSDDTVVRGERPTAAENEEEPPASSGPEGTQAGAAADPQEGPTASGSDDGSTGEAARTDPGLPGPRQS